MKLKRYTWEDTLIQAQVDKRISNGALLVALKLSKAINWAPTEKDRAEPGLYWKNDDALKAVGCGRSTYFDHREELFSTGFFVMVRNNLIPRLPEESEVRTDDVEEESAVGTGESAVRTTESGVRTEESAGQHPCSEDILSEDLVSEDDVEEADSAGATSDETSEEEEPSLSHEDDQTFPYPSEEAEGRVSRSEDGSAESAVRTKQVEEEEPTSGVPVLDIHNYNAWDIAEQYGVKRKAAKYLSEGRGAAYAVIRALQDAGVEV